jgi:hypothetical protein
MSRERFRLALILVVLCAMFGCSGGDDDGPTDPATLCALPWAGTRSWFLRGGCAGSAASDLQGTGTATFSNCTITMEITPQAEKAKGATWTLSANLQAGTAQVVRANTECAATDTGTVRMASSSAVADLHSPSTPGCNCNLVYTVSIPQPQ